MYFLQISALQVAPVSRYLSWLSFANLSASASRACLAPLTPLQQLGLTMATPALLLAVAAALAALHLAAHRCYHARRSRGRSGFHEQRDAGAAAARGSSGALLSGALRLWAAAAARATSAVSTYSWSSWVGCGVSVLLFSYTSVPVAVVSALHCVAVAPGVQRLFSAPSVDCSDGNSAYTAFRVGAILLLVGFVVGFPAATLLFLWRLRARLQRLQFAQEHQQQQQQPQPQTPLQPSPLKDVDHSAPAALAASESPSLSVTSAAAPAPTAADVRFVECWGPLYLAYTARAFYWQPLLLLRRFLYALPAVLLTQQPAQQYALFDALAIASLLLHSFARPYTDDRINQTDVVPTCCCSAAPADRRRHSTAVQRGRRVEVLLLVLPFALLVAAWTAWVTWRRLRASRADPQQQQAQQQHAAAADGENELSRGSLQWESHGDAHSLAVQRREPLLAPPLVADDDER